MAQISVTDAFLAESSHLLDQAMIKIRHCLDQLTDEQAWWRPSEPLNSVGNLMLHLSGNLRQWAVAGIGGQPDHRDRPTEFAQRQTISRQSLLDQLQTTVDQAKLVFGKLSEADLLERRTIQEFEVTVLGAISHTVSHFVGHSHQIIYITRLIVGEKYQFQWSPASERAGVPM